VGHASIGTTPAAGQSFQALEPGATAPDVLRRPGGPGASGAPGGLSRWIA